VPLPVLYKSTSAMLPVLSPLLLLAASPTLDEPALFLYGNKSPPLEVLNSSDLQLLSASRRLGTCHPSALASTRRPSAPLVCSCSLKRM
jgi:hypothetical protein